ncbi:hypothetical protein ACJRO7_011382 [Eucalyptus globulus]|uniref:Uncharacterized protein n=1 Tax=Eucalyptus globulus TaxID=34317 RepID=A0ABD3LJK9_EUCGL
MRETYETTTAIRLLIFIVPERLRRSNAEAYAPHAVAIGPYHRQLKSFEPMEDHKLMYLQTFLKNPDLNKEVGRLEEVDRRLEELEFDPLEEFDRLKFEPLPLKEVKEVGRLRLKEVVRPEEDQGGVPSPLIDRLRDDQVVRNLEELDLLDLLNFKEVELLPREEVIRLEECIQIIKSCEKDALSYYDKKIELNSNWFTEMMLLGGIFVIQIFLMSRFLGMRLPSDRIFSRPWILKDVCRDMTLLENQIPFFIIRRLAFSGENWYRLTLLLELMYKFFSQHTQVEESSEESPEARRLTEVKHIVHALRLSFLPSMNVAPHRGNEPIKFSPRATKLLAAGVKLKRGES